MQSTEFENLDPRKFIIIKGARVNNLKNVSLAIPRNQFVVFTGLSGSGKSSLAFDTLYADGQRRYVESLSSYARQFLGRMQKPDVDYIKGISPAIAIEQKVNSRNPRSTVGTSTEIYDYLKLLFARIGKTYSPVSGKLVARNTVTDVVNFIENLPQNTRLLILSPVSVQGKKPEDVIAILIQQGFSRIKIAGKIERIDQFVNNPKPLKKLTEIQIVIDRLEVDKTDPYFSSRASDSVQTAFYESDGYCQIEVLDEEGSRIENFSNRYEADGITFEEPDINLFSFNNPFGACKKCEGFGSVIGIDEDLVVPDKSLSVYEFAISCWKGEKLSLWRDQLVKSAHLFDFPIHKPFYELTKAQKELIWRGNEHFNGLDAFFEMLEENLYKIQYRVLMSRYRGKTICPVCKGTRLRQDANYVKIEDKSISDLVVISVSSLIKFFDELALDSTDEAIAKRILVEIKSRLHFLQDVGLGYLTLNRLSNSLSGGESQRINLATSLGSSLVGSMYILDEPSIGLHPRDTKRLISVLMNLRNLGNTVIVVEHDEDIIRSSDYVVDIGPYAGINGGEIVYSGKTIQMLENSDTLTARFMRRQLTIPLPGSRRFWNNFIEITGARENNLKNVTVRFPLNILTAITGVSGSGKSSLVKNILYPALKKQFGGFNDKTGNFDSLKGDYQKISFVEFVDQNPIGRSSRSNPATYIKAYDDIRELYSLVPLSKSRSYKPGYFSFNIPGGRCEECEGEGNVKIEMQFMADIYLRCESCGGKRFRNEVLDIKYQEKDISDILDLNISEAIIFFSQHKGSIEKKIITKLKSLEDVGLGYLKLGQSSSTLSGGEAQRVKLAFFLAKGEKDSPTLFILDEPTTGLHFYDINKLLDSFTALINKGHSIIVIEHNLEIIKCADWIIELGPEGGEEGGYIIFEGTPEQLVRSERSYTANYLKDKLEII